MNKILFFGAGLIAGYALNKIMSDSGPAAQTTSGNTASPPVSAAMGKRKWVHVDAHRRHYPGMGATIHTVIVPPPHPAAPVQRSRMGFIPDNQWSLLV